MFICFVSQMSVFTKSNILSYCECSFKLLVLLVSHPHYDWYIWLQTMLSFLNLTVAVHMSRRTERELLACMLMWCAILWNVRYISWFVTDFWVFYSFNWLFSCIHNSKPLYIPTENTAFNQRTSSLLSYRCYKYSSLSGLLLLVRSPANLECCVCKLH
jgi:hypothetical protein